MWRRLFHRWFIEYNPLYLLSAALVLRGVNVISHELLRAGHNYAELGGPAIAELYAWALIGGAALLLRVGLRRPAVMLSLIAVLYQGDLTLHSETCVYLGSVGSIASVAWLASFVLKLIVLARAMRLRVSRSAFVVPSFGAAGLVIVPRLVQHASAHTASVVIASWLFALVALALATSRVITTTTSLDAWGQTVLRRSLRATWAIWAALAALHVVFWFSARELAPAVLVPLPLLLATRFMPRRSHVCIATGGALVLVACVAPSFLSFTAVLGAFTLAAHTAKGIMSRASVEPLVVATISCLYLAAWTATESSALLPPHIAWLDAAYAIAMVLCAWRLRVRTALIPLVVAGAHYAIQARVVTAPITGLEWGVWSAVTGFIMLVATVSTSVAVHVRRTD